MSVRFQHQSIIPTSSSDIQSPKKAFGINLFYKEVIRLDQVLCRRGISKQRWRLRYGLSECDRHIVSFRWLDSRQHETPCHKPKRLMHSTRLSSTDDGVTVNGTPQASSSSDVKELRLKLDQTLQGEDLSGGLVQSLHDAARATELAIKEHISLFHTSWFSKTWLGVDKNAWVKTLSYQAAVYSLLQAAVEISSRGNGRDRDTNVFVQRSITRQSAPLANVIRDELSANQPGTDEWFWSEQHPMAVTTFVNIFERDPGFTAATTVCQKGVTSDSGSASDLQLLMLAMSCIAAVIKIGPAKVSCSHLFSTVPDTTGRLMDKLIDFVPIKLAYSSINDIALRREFLLHFGPRAASCRVKNDQGIEEMTFLVDLVQKQRQRAIDREKIWSRPTTCESLEVGSGNPLVAEQSAKPLLFPLLLDIRSEF